MEKPTPRFNIFDEVCLSSDTSECFRIRSIHWDFGHKLFMYQMEEHPKGYSAGAPEYMLREYIRPFFEWRWAYATDGGSFGITETHFTDKEMRNIVFHNRNMISYEKIDFTKRMRSK